MKDSDIRVLYFGCIGGPGHYMHTEGGRRDWDVTTPWGKAPDGTLCPQGKQVEGRAELHHKGGWTALSFWDRSVDGRSGCNSNFFVNRTMTFDEVVALSKERLPRVWSRFKFDVVPATFNPAHPQ
jgi:hypothetical protein